MQILLSNIKVAGVYLTISLLYVPVVTWLWNRLEAAGEINAYPIAVSLSVLALVLYFLAGRYVLRSTGTKLGDIFSFSAVAAIYLIGPFTLLDDAIGFLYSPHILSLIAFETNLNQSIVLGVALAFITSSTAVFAGIITRSRVLRGITD